MPSYSRHVQIPGKSSQELYDTVNEGIETLLKKAALGNFEIDRDPEHKELKIKGSLFSATLSCREAEMELQAQLSLIALPFKSKLDEMISKWVSKTFKA